jgi:hypothetical protein
MRQRREAARAGMSLKIAALRAMMAAGATSGLGF